jgi:ADP-ribosylglycohydrolase
MKRTRHGCKGRKLCSGHIDLRIQQQPWQHCSDFGDALGAGIEFLPTGTLEPVNLGDDSDTTGAVCGQLAGACWGEDGIPKRWRSGLARADMIESALAGLVEASATE